MRYSDVVKQPKIEVFKDQEGFWDLVGLSYGELADVETEEDILRLKSLVLDRLNEGGEFASLWFGMLERIENVKEPLARNEIVLDTPYWDCLMNVQKIGKLEKPEFKGEVGGVLMRRKDQENLEKVSEIVANVEDNGIF